MATFQFSDTSPTITSYVGGKETVVSKPRKTSGRSSSSARRAREAADAARKASEAAEQKRLEEIQKQLEAEKQAQAEKARIEQLRKAIVAQGAQQNTRILRNQEGDRIRQTTTQIRKIENGKSVNALVWKYENLNTGEVKYRAYEKKAGQGGRKLTGAVDVGGQSKSQSKSIQTELKKAGLNPVVNKDGIVVGFRSSDTQKTYSYDEAGIRAYDKDSQQGGAIFRKYLRDYKNQYGMSKADTDDKKMSLKTRIAVGFSSPTQAVKTTRNIAKLLLTSSKQIPRVLADYGISVAKGGVKVGLYAIDEAGYIKSIKYNPNNRKFYIPRGTKAITDKMGKVKNWSNYDFKTNPLRDPDYQTFAVTTAFALLGLTSAAMATRLFGVVKGKAVWDAVNNPTPYNIAIAESMFLPGLVKRGKKVLSRRDIIVAKAGDLVPLKERITQVDYLVKNSGKSVDAVTATPRRKVTIRKITSKSNPDYAYGVRTEFATYKVGKAYPTSEYFLKGKARGIQKLLKTGSVKIERVTVSRLNAKYGSYIKKMLLSKGKVPESFIKKYYLEAKMEANRLGKPVAVISPKRLRGFAQPEQELIKILPDNYKPVKTRFAGITEEGYRVFSDKSYLRNLKDFIKTKFRKGSIDSSYWEAIAKDKLAYLKGRPSIRGEYAEHGKAHLLAENVDPYAKNYARKMNVKKFGNTFKQHDLAKVSDSDPFVQFEHGKVLYDLWKKGKYPDKNIYKLPRKVQKQIAEAYAGHTPVAPKLLTSLKRGWKNNSVIKDLIWYAKNKRNPILQDTLTIDRLELPRQGRWNIKVKYNLLDKNALKRIYGSELNAVKNIRFLDWKTVPGRLKRAIGRTELKQIAVRDRRVLMSLKKLRPSRNVIARKYKSVSTIKKPIYQTTFYNSLKSKNYKLAYKKGYESGYKSVYKKPTNYSTKYGKYQKFYAKGYSDAYKGDYKIVYKAGKYVPIKYIGTKYKPVTGYKPTKYQSGYFPMRRGTDKKIPIILPTLKQFKPQTLRKAQPTYYVVEKVRGKFKKLYPKPLTAKDARDYAVYSIDNRLSKTAFFVPLGKSKKTLSPPKQIQNYFAKNSRKVRPYKIRFGKKKQMVNGYIEKRRFFQDTAGEKSQAARLRMIAKSRKPMVKRKITPTQRKVLIARLKLARAVRMRNLRKKK